jgi:hypothetical protein
LNGNSTNDSRQNDVRILETYDWWKRLNSQIKMRSNFELANSN